MVSPGVLPRLKCFVFMIAVTIVVGVAFIYSGFYPVGADDRHTPVTYWALDTLRERSVSRAAQSIEVPVELNTSTRLLRGGSDYQAMCVSCHLAPDMSESDFTKGLNPAPPNLTQHQGDENLESRARSQFWVIKHGIKASGMPAWGPGHDDERIWNIVAFLQRLPELSPEQYQILTARGSANSNNH